MTFMQNFLSRLQECVASPLLTGIDTTARYQHDWSAEPPGVPLAVVRPATTEEVAAILSLCSECGQSVVVQGGLSGLCGGANPQNGEVAISLDRLSGIEEIDHDSMTLTVKAGIAA